jgi:hypothetical protein
MASTLSDFVMDHADELRAHCLAGLDTASRTHDEDDPWFAAVLGDLASALRAPPAQPFSLEFGATPEAAHRGWLHQRSGRRVSALMQDFGLVCDSICTCARRFGQRIDADEFRLMNLWLDGAAAASLDEYVVCLSSADRDAHLGATAMFAIEVGNATAVMRLVVDSAIADHDGFGGGAAALLGRSLARIEALVSRHIAASSLVRGPRGPAS